MFAAIRVMIVLGSEDATSHPGAGRIHRRDRLARARVRPDRRPPAIGLPDPGRFGGRIEAAAPAGRKGRRAGTGLGGLAPDHRDLPPRLPRLPLVEGPQAGYGRPGLVRADAQPGGSADHARRPAHRGGHAQPATPNCSCRGIDRFVHERGIPFTGRNYEGSRATLAHVGVELKRPTTPPARARPVAHGAMGQLG